VVSLAASLVGSKLSFRGLSVFVCILLGVLCFGLEHYWSMGIPGMEKLFCMRSD
jgi:hypothetical protein